MTRVLTVEQRERRRAVNKAWRESPSGKASRKAYRERNPNYERDTTRAYRARMSDTEIAFKSFETSLRRHGLTLDQYHSILERQDFVCPICGIDVVSREQKLTHIDHDHNTGKVRGILCARCNCALGKFEDGKLFAPAERYIERANKRAA